MSHEPRADRWSKLRPLLLFAAAWLVVDVGVRLTADLWTHYAADDYSERIERCAAEPRDLIVLGGSPVSEGIDPALLGDNARSLALPGGTITDSYFAYKHGAPTKPKRLIVGVAATDFNDARNEPHGAYSIYTSADVADIARTRRDAASWTMRRFGEGQLRQVSAVYQHRRGLFLAAADLAASVDTRIAPETSAIAARDYGYAESLRAGRGYAPAPWFAHADYAARKARGESFPPFDFLERYSFGSHFAYLERLMNERDGTTVVIVEMPYTEDFEVRFAERLAEFRTRLTTWETERGWPLLRATRESLKLSDADFGDFVHLNRGGAAKMTAWLKAEILRRDAEAAR